jgi:hypothetical protein
MSQYLVLIYEDESAWANATEAQANTIMAEHAAFGERNGSGLVGGNTLQPTSTATSIRRDGADGFSITDAPFAETTEALGGYYLIEAHDLDAAIAVAKQVPAAVGGVEIRPILTFD